MAIWIFFYVLGFFLFLFFFPQMVTRAVRGTGVSSATCAPLSCRESLWCCALSRFGAEAGATVLPLCLRRGTTSMALEALRRMCLPGYMYMVHRVKMEDPQLTGVDLSLTVDHGDVPLILSTGGKMLSRRVCVRMHN